MYEDRIKVYALIKLIGYIKFSCTEDAALEFAASPIIGEALSDLKQLMNSGSGRDTILDIEQLDFRFKRTLLAAVSRNLKKTENWHKMTEADQVSHVENLASPYLISTEQIKDLIAERNK
jgi:hypothetical protein